MLFILGDYLKWFLNGKSSKLVWSDVITCNDSNPQVQIDETNNKQILQIDKKTK